MYTSFLCAIAENRTLIADLCFHVFSNCLLLLRFASNCFQVSFAPCLAAYTGHLSSAPKPTVTVEFRKMDHPLFHLLSFPDELERSLNPPAQKYVRDSKARASTAMDVKEHPQSYVFVADMPGLKSADIKVHRCPTNLCHILKCCIHTWLRAGKQRGLRCAYPITVFRELCAS